MASANKYYFVSYSHKDSEKVLPIVNGLKRRGVLLWYDAGIVPGDEWQDVLGKKIISSSGIIPFLSRNFVSSRQCKKELDFADSLGTPIFPIYLEDCVLTPGLNLQLCGKQAVFKYKLSDQGFYQAILKNLNVAPKIKKVKPGKGSDAENYASAMKLIENGNYLQAYQLLSPLSEKGNRNATSEIAEMHLTGRGAQYDPAKAIELHSLAAESKVLKSINALGNIYLLGLGTNVDKNKAVRYFEKAAELGDCDTAQALGGWYNKGQNVSKDTKKAFRYYNMAARKNPEAMYCVGEAYSDGNGVKRDPIKAYSFYLKSAKLGYSPSIIKAAECLINGRGVSANTDKAKELLNKISLSNYPKADILLAGIYESAQNYPVAFKLYHHAQEQGDLDAKLKTADFYYKGLGVVKNSKRAQNIYKSLALAGNLEAAKKYALCCMNSLGGADEINAAYEYLKEVTEKINDKEAWLYLGDLYQNKSFNGYNTIKAEDCYLTSLRLGNKTAAYRLGKMHFDGSARHPGYRRAYEYFKLAASNENLACYHYIALQSYYGIGIQEDKCEAFKMAYRAVNSGYEKSANLLGLCYFNGEGVTANDQKAYQYFCMAYKSGDLSAANNLAVCLLLGKGVSRDVKRAVKILSDNQSSPACVFTLAECCELGFGTEKNEAKSEELYQRAFDMGYGEAGMRIYKLMSAGGVNIRKNNVKALSVKTRAKKMLNYDCAIALSENTINEVFTDYMLNGRAPTPKPKPISRVNPAPIAKPRTDIEGEYIIVKRKPRTTHALPADDSSAAKKGANAKSAAAKPKSEAAQSTKAAGKSAAAPKSKKGSAAVASTISRQPGAAAAKEAAKSALPPARSKTNNAANASKTSAIKNNAAKKALDTREFIASAASPNKETPSAPVIRKRGESISISSETAKRINSVKTAGKNK